MHSAQLIPQLLNFRFGDVLFVFRLGEDFRNFLQFLEDTFQLALDMRHFSARLLD